MEQHSESPLTTLQQIRDMLKALQSTRKLTNGGYPDEIFYEFDREGNDDLMCNICYMVLRKTRECANGHRFCSGCIRTWLDKGGANTSCPVCRVDGDYTRNGKLDERISHLLVMCRHEDCRWGGDVAGWKRHTKQHSCKRRKLADKLPCIHASVSLSSQTLTPVTAVTAVTGNLARPPPGVTSIATSTAPGTLPLINISLPPLTRRVPDTVWTDIRLPDVYMSVNSRSTTSNHSGRIEQLLAETSLDLTHSGRTQQTLTDTSSDLTGSGRTEPLLLSDTSSENASDSTSSGSSSRQTTPTSVLTYQYLYNTSVSNVISSHNVTRPDTTRLDATRPDTTLPDVLSYSITVSPSTSTPRHSPDGTAQSDNIPSHDTPDPDRVTSDPNTATVEIETETADSEDRESPEPLRMMTSPEARLLSIYQMRSSMRDIRRGLDSIVSGMGSQMQSRQVADNISAQISRMRRHSTIEMGDLMRRLESVVGQLADFVSQSDSDDILY